MHPPEFGAFLLTQRDRRCRLERRAIAHEHKMLGRRPGGKLRHPSTYGWERPRRTGVRRAAAEIATGNITAWHAPIYHPPWRVPGGPDRGARGCRPTSRYHGITLPKTLHVRINGRAVTTVLGIDASSRAVDRQKGQSTKENRDNLHVYLLLTDRFSVTLLCCQRRPLPTRE